MASVVAARDEKEKERRDASGAARATARVERSAPPLVRAEFSKLVSR